MALTRNSKRKSLCFATLAMLPERSECFRSSSSSSLFSARCQLKRQHFLHYAVHRRRLGNELHIASRPSERMRECHKLDLHSCALYTFITIKSRKSKHFFREILLRLVAYFGEPSGVHGELKKYKINSLFWNLPHSSFIAVNFASDTHRFTLLLANKKLVLCHEFNWSENRVKTSRNETKEIEKMWNTADERNAFTSVLNVMSDWVANLA